MTEARNYSGVSQVKLGYDAYGRLVRREHTSPLAVGAGRSKVELYAHVGGLRVSVYSGNTSTKAVTLIRAIAWGPDLSGTVGGAGGIGGLLSVRETAASTSSRKGLTMLLGHDAKGDVTSVWSADGAYLGGYVTQAFGQVTILSGANAYLSENQWRLASKPHEWLTGYSHWGRRWFSPFLGRWVSRDPIGEEGGINLYSVSGNDPVCGLDPWGEDKIADATKSAGVKPVGNAAEFIVGGIGGGAIAATGAILSGGDPYVSYWDFTREFHTYSDKQCTFMITINGMFNFSDKDRLTMSKTAAANAVKNYGEIQDVRHVHNEAGFLGLSSLMKMFSTHLSGSRGGESALIVQEVARAVEAGKRNCCKKIKVLVVAHSQGASFLLDAIRDMPADLLEYVYPVTYGAQQAVPNAFNLAHADDPVPFFDVSPLALTMIIDGSGHRIETYDKANIPPFFTPPFSPVSK